MDKTAAERMRRYRNKQRNIVTDESVTNGGVTGQGVTPVKPPAEVPKGVVGTTYTSY